MKLSTLSVFLLFAGAALSVGGAFLPTASACEVVIGGSCGNGCTNSVVNVGCGSENCYILVLSSCTSGGTCFLTIGEVVQPHNTCKGGQCFVTVGDCLDGGFNGDVGTCTVTVEVCNGNGSCTVNVGQCNFACTINVGVCSSVLPGGRCEVNTGSCDGNCTINLDLCQGTDNCLIHVLSACRP